jgi:hypothetical protein
LLNPDFEKIEASAYIGLRETADYTQIKNMALLSRLPLMHNSFKARINVIAEKSIFNNYNFEASGVENIAIRSFFKAELLFKLFLLYILFGIHMKGINTPIFISLLIIYYW